MDGSCDAGERIHWWVSWALKLKTEELGLGCAIRPPIKLLVDWASTSFVLRLSRGLSGEGFSRRADRDGGGGGGGDDGAGTGEGGFGEKGGAHEGGILNLSLLSSPLVFLVVFFRALSFQFLFFDFGWRQQK